MNATENMLEERVTGGAPRCRWGSATESPCWREATEALNRGELAHLCGEHATVRRCGEAVDAWAMALDSLEEFLSGPVAENPYAALEELILNAREEARRHYADAHARLQAAELVADQGPPEAGERLLGEEEAAELARLIIRADSFAAAETVLVDAPRSAFLRAGDKWATIDALATAGAEAERRVDDYKRSIGLLLE